MAFNLASLIAMGQAGASTLGELEPLPGEEELEPLPSRDTINVNANLLQPSVDQLGAEPPFMGNRRYREEAALSNLDPGRDPELGRRGMFGLRGTLREVLGTLGDAFLVQGGGEATYRPQRQREQISDAMAGFTSADPVAQMAAVERVSYINPEAGRQLLEQLQSQSATMAQQQAIAAQNQAENQEAQEASYARLRSYAARVLNSVVDNPDRLPYALSVITDNARRAGFSIEDLGLNAEMTPEQISTYAAGDMPVNQQLQLPLAERRVATGEYRAETGRQVANRPRPAPQGRSETDSERAVRIGNSSNRTPGEQAWYDRWVRGGEGASSGPQLPSSTPTPRRLTMPRVN